MFDFAKSILFVLACLTGASAWSAESGRVPRSPEEEVQGRIAVMAQRLHQLAATGPESAGVGPLKSIVPLKYSFHTILMTCMRAQKEMARSSPPLPRTSANAPIKIGACSQLISLGLSKGLVKEGEVREILQSIADTFRKEKEQEQAALARDERQQQQVQSAVDRLVEYGDSLFKEN
jgi:hypothetical protein